MRRLRHLTRCAARRGDPQLALPFSEPPAPEKGQLASARCEGIGAVQRGDSAAHPPVVEPQVSHEQVVGDPTIIGMSGVEEERHGAVVRAQAARDSRRELPPGRSLRAADAEEGYGRSSLDCHEAGSGPSATPFCAAQVARSRRARASKSALRSCLRWRSASGGNRAWTTLVGWYSYPGGCASPLTCRRRAPMALVAGGGTNSVPCRRARLRRAATCTDAGLSTYPSTPVICPAQYTCGRAFKEPSGAIAREALRNVFRCTWPSRTHSASCRPGMQVEKIRFCSGQVSRVWKPTMFQAVPAMSSRRSWTTACGRRPVRGSVSPTGFIGPYARTSRPRSALTSLRRHPFQQ